MTSYLYYKEQKYSFLRAPKKCPLNNLYPQIHPQQSTLTPRIHPPFHLMVATIGIHPYLDCQMPPFLSLDERVYLRNLCQLIH